MYRRLIGSLTFALALPLHAQARPDWRAFDTWVARGVRTWEVPGLAVAVVKDDSVVFAKGYGVRQLGTSDPVDAHTLFAIGSTTKAMTALSILMLADEDKVRLEDPVLRFLPTLQLYDPQMTRELMVRDLLTHHTGLPGSDLLWTGGDYSTAEVIRRMRWLQPVGSFRSVYNYQNVQYAMAGEVVRVAAGMPWEAFVTKRIFEPLGMRETVPLLSGTRGRPNVAVPHLRIGDTIRVIENRSVDPVAAAGSVWSSVTDMATWMRFVLDSGRVGGRQLVSTARFEDWLSPQAVVPVASFYPTSRLTRPHQVNYGLGWFLEDYRGMSVAMHTGSIDGMVAIIGLVPDQRLGVYVLANLDHAELRHALMHRVFDLYAGPPLRDWSAEFKELYDDLDAAGRAAEAQQRASRVSGTRPALPLDRYAGTYVDSLYGTLIVSHENGRLRARFGKGYVGPLDHWHYETFVATWDDRRLGSSPLTFVLGADGAPARIELVAGAPVTFHRKP
ncbi:MAG: serine hydrolase [Gemmatimonadaceae bacterium]|nr:serine hydrolase [Gemmatimonadaceae bacterium]